MPYSGEKLATPSACPAWAPRWSSLRAQRAPPPLIGAQPTWLNFLSIKGRVWERPGRGRWAAEEVCLSHPLPPPSSPEEAVTSLGAPVEKGRSPESEFSKFLPHPSSSVPQFTTLTALPTQDRPRSPCRSTRGLCEWSTIPILRLNKLRSRAEQGRGRSAQQGPGVGR